MLQSKHAQSKAHEEPGMALQAQSRPCPVCCQLDRSSLFADSNIDATQLDAFAFASRKLPEYMHLRLMLCQRCDLLYVSPMPEPDALAKAYDEADYDSAEEARFAARTYRRILDSLYPAS